MPRLGTTACAVCCPNPLLSLTFYDAGPEGMQEGMSGVLPDPSAPFLLDGSHSRQTWVRFINALATVSWKYPLILSE
jgi:hypothetical protein